MISRSLYVKHAPQKNHNGKKNGLFVKSKKNCHIPNNHMNEALGCKYNSEESNRNIIFFRYRPFSRRVPLYMYLSVIVFLPPPLTSPPTSVHFQAIFFFLLSQSLSSLLPDHLSDLLSWIVLLVFTQLRQLFQILILVS